MKSFFWKHTWLIRQFFYKIKMFRRFNPYLVKEWECVEALMFIPFEIFKDFYKYNFIKNKSRVDWEYSDTQKKVKKNMDQMYDYLVRLRPAYEKKQNYYTDEWGKLFSFEFIPTEGSKKLLEIKGKYSENKKEIAEEYFTKAREYEEIIREKDEYYLKLLIEMKDYMWE